MPRDPQGSKLPEASASAIIWASSSRPIRLSVPFPRRRDSSLATDYSFTSTTNAATNRTALHTPKVHTPKVETDATAPIPIAMAMRASSSCLFMSLLSPNHPGGSSFGLVDVHLVAPDGQSGSRDRCDVRAGQCFRPRPHVCEVSFVGRGNSFRQRVLADVGDGRLLVLARYDAGAELPAGLGILARGRREHLDPFGFEHRHQ